VLEIVPELFGLTITGKDCESLRYHKATVHSVWSDTGRQLTTAEVERVARRSVHRSSLMRTESSPCATVR
jgi:hypothetical protein